VAKRKSAVPFNAASIIEAENTLEGYEIGLNKLEKLAEELF